MEKEDDYSRHCGIEKRHLVEKVDFQMLNQQLWKVCSSSIRAEFVRTATQDIQLASVSDLDIQKRKLILKHDYVGMEIIELVSSS